MMMTSLAQVRQVLTGHSDRALVIAVDALGHVHKLEMPAGAVRDVKERDTMLVLSWSFHAVPLADAKDLIAHLRAHAARPHRSTPARRVGAFHALPSAPSPAARRRRRTACC